MGNSLLPDKCITFFSEKTSCVFIAGSNATVGVFNGDFNTKKLPKLPANIKDPSMFKRNGSIFLCGGMLNYQECLKLSHGIWEEHSTLNEPRYIHSAVAIQTGTFIFGGLFSSTTYEYLPKDSTTWVMGKNEIPGGFYSGCAIAVKSEQEIWLIGGDHNEKRILAFNVDDHTFNELPLRLNVRRVGHGSAYIPNTSKIIITGGHEEGFGTDFLNSTEILDTNSGSIIMASPMNFKRYSHGIGAITIKGEEKLAVFGGVSKVDRGKSRLDRVEIYNNETDKWETMPIKLTRAGNGFGGLRFGFLGVKLADVIKIKPYHN